MPANKRSKSDDKKGLPLDKAMGIVQKIDESKKVAIAPLFPWPFKLYPVEHDCLPSISTEIRNCYFAGLEMARAGMVVRGEMCIREEEGGNPKRLALGCLVGVHWLGYRGERSDRQLQQVWR